MTPCTSKFKARLSRQGHQQDVSAPSHLCCKVGFALAFVEHTPLFGQADIGSKPKQTRYQSINSTVSSLDLHFRILACQHGRATLHLVCLNTNSTLNTSPCP